MRIFLPNQTPFFMKTGILSPQNLSRKEFLIYLHKQTRIYLFQKLSNYEQNLRIFR